MQAITVSLNYTLPGLVSLQLAYSSLGSLWLLGSGISGLLARTVSRFVSLSQAVWSLGSQDWLIAAGAYPGLCSKKRLEVFLLPLDGMLVHRRSPPRNLSGFSSILPVSIYTPGWGEALWEWSVLPKNTTQCPWPGLEPGPFAPESSALIMRPPSLPHITSRNGGKFFCLKNQVLSDNEK